MSLNEILPNPVRPKPIREAGPTIATEHGWVCVHDHDGSHELLTEWQGLKTFLADNGYDENGDVVAPPQPEGVSVVARTIVEAPAEVVEEVVEAPAEVVEEVVEAPAEVVEEVPMTRQTLTEMEYSKLKDIAIANEVTEKSREKIVNELCVLFGLE